MKTTRQTFDDEFKLMTIALCDTGKSVNEVSKELDIRSELVRRWKREFGRSGSGSFSGHGNANLTSEQREIATLKKQLREAELEKDILKKAVSIFSKSDGKYSGL